MEQNSPTAVTYEMTDEEMEEFHRLEELNEVIIKGGGPVMDFDDLMIMAKKNVAKEKEHLMEETQSLLPGLFKTS